MHASTADEMQWNIQEIHHFIHIAFHAVVNPPISIFLMLLCCKDCT